jgi:hypothetical protein
MTLRPIILLIALSVAPIHATVTPDHQRRRPANHGKLSGKEPTVFTGDRKDAEAFILEWQIYQMLNYDAEVMRQPFTRATLFLSFIKGPAVHEWNMLQVNWLMTRARTRALPTEEFLYDTIECHSSANRSHRKSNRMGNGRSIM